MCGGHIPMVDVRARVPPSSPEEGESPAPSQQWEFARDHLPGRGEA